MLLITGRSTVIDYLQKRAPPSSQPVLYFYFDIASGESQNGKHVTGCLLKQLLSSLEVLPESIASTFERFRMSLVTPAFEDLLNILLSSSSAFTTVFIVLDGLYQCQFNFISDM